jgi:adenosylcobinamide amidohydrolase
MERHCEQDQLRGTNDPFFLRVVGATLVVTFRDPCRAVSWAPLHGGFRTEVAHIISCQVRPDSQLQSPDKILRQSASKVGIKGAVVGILTFADVRHYSMEKAESSNLCVRAISIVGVVNLASNDETRRTGPRSALNSGFNLIVSVNEFLTHETMLEAISIATEAKTKVIYGLGLPRRGREQGVTGAISDCVIITSNGRGRERGGDQRVKLPELIDRACSESLRTGIRSSLSRTPSSSRQFKNE